MKPFYQSTYYLWIITKGIFSVAGFISAIDNLGILDLTTTEKLANFIGLAYAVLLAIDTVMSLTGNYLKPLKYANGTISVLLGIIIFVLPFFANVISVPITVLFSVWIILLGVFDLLVVKRSSEYLNDTIN